MKKSFNVLILILICSCFTFAGCKKSQKANPQNLPSQVRVTLPTGEVVTAYRMQPTAQKAPSGTRLVVSGRISRETDDLGSMQLILQTDTDAKYILLNPPFMIRLEKDALGKKAKIKGVTIEKTTFKNYPAIYVEDILDVY